MCRSGSHSPHSAVEARDRLLNLVRVRAKQCAWIVQHPLNMSRQVIDCSTGNGVDPVDLEVEQSFSHFVFKE